MAKQTRRHALEIFQAALQAANPERAVLDHLKRGRLTGYDRIQVIGAGKATAAMARAVEQRLGKRISGGVICVPDGTGAVPRRIETMFCGHPIPDKRGMAGARRILEIAQAAGRRDLLICLISGGASALLPAPAPPLTLRRKQEITQRLLRAGATIHEMNVVRKHLSLIKGGQLAQAAWPATILTLILSDVVGDDPSVIGSGPTVADPSTREDAIAILKRYEIGAPHAALRETPKPNDVKLARASYEIVGSNRQAIRAAARKARERGYHTLVLSTSIQGETREVAAVHAAIAREILETGQPLRPPACVLSGGETTVTVRGKGLGGRNQEFVLAAALALEGAGPVTILSAGTDGIDGPTDAAGAIADPATLDADAARRSLENNDSYHYFEDRNELIKTGPTGTNVMDVRLLLIDRTA